jgi:hypothetical protein
MELGEEVEGNVGRRKDRDSKPGEGPVLDLARCSNNYRSEAETRTHHVGSQASVAWGVAQKVEVTR